MDRCPSCSQSRWVYHRSVPFTEFVTSLTGWHPFECLSCGWRGWRPLRTGSTIAFRYPLLQFLGNVRSRASRASGRIRVLGSALVLRRRPQTLTRTSALTRAVLWMIPAFALGVLLGALLLSAAAPRPDPETLQASDGLAALQPVARVLPPDDRTPEAVRAVESHEPAIVPMALEEPRADPPPAESAATSGSATPASPRETAGTPPTAPGANAVRSTAASPRYRGSLVIDSDPRGARVSLNGQFVGSTPILLENLPAGSCVVRVESDGYEPWSTAARVIANRKNRVSAALQRGSNQP